MTEYTISSIEAALDAYRSGRFVIIVDDEDRENEGDLAIAADYITPEAVNFMAVHGRGLICLAMRGALLDRLKIPMMVPQAQNRSGFGTGFTVSVEATKGVTTGISAADRSHTISTLINPASTPVDIAMPGHIFPLRARDGGVLERRGQTEASVDLAVLGDLTPAGVICEVMAADGTMMRLPALREFAALHGIPIISVEDLVQYRKSLGSVNVKATVNTANDVKAAATVIGSQPDNTASIQGTGIAEGLPDCTATGVTDEINNSDQASPVEQLVTRIGESELPTVHGDFRVIVFRDQQGLEHSALVKGKLSDTAPLVRLHSECLTGDTFGSLRCDCGEQLKAAMAQIAAEGTGVILYLRQEGRGIGLGNKIRAYALQDTGFDTVDANQVLGFPVDAREYDVAAAMLGKLGIAAVRLMSNNPLKARGLESLGIDVVDQHALQVPAQEKNLGYLQTKARRMGHTLDVENMAI
jgi:3,4-dihydroxy 2-butanone 4-phosphate synthase/GTP cyclohydrolase II